MTTTHQTKTYSFEDPDHTHGIATWWGWSCTCGAGSEGVDRLFASDLARTHLERVAPCTCANPTITREDSFPSRGFRCTCDCGYDEVVGSLGRGSLMVDGQTLRDEALRRLMQHKCRVLAGHTHPAPETAEAVRDARRPRMAGSAAR